MGSADEISFAFSVFVSSDLNIIRRRGCTQMFVK